MAGRDDEFKKRLEEASKAAAGGRVLGPTPDDLRQMRTRTTIFFRNVGLDIGQTNDEEGITRQYQMTIEDLAENKMYVFGFLESTREAMIEALQKLTDIGEKDPDWVEGSGPTPPPPTILQ